MYNVHTKRVQASQARKDFFRLLDEVACGEVVVIERHGRRLVLRREADWATASPKDVPDYSRLLWVPKAEEADRWTWEWKAWGGRLKIESPALYEAIEKDRRFLNDEPRLLAVVRKVLTLTWTRDPFDRLLAAHSSTARLPLCTLDEKLLRHHPVLVAELRPRA